MSTNRLVIDVIQTHNHPGLKWEKDVRPEAPKEFVSELLEEGQAREILGKIADATPKFKDAFSLVRSSKDPSKRRVLVYLPLMGQLKQLNAIATYLNNNHAPEGHTTWEVIKVVSNDVASYPICYTNFPAFDGRFNAIHEQLYKWLDQPRIAELFKLVKPEHQRHRTIYMVSNGELLQELHKLVTSISNVVPRLDRGTQGI